MSDQDHGATVNEWVNVVRRAQLDRTTKYVALVVATYADPDGTSVYPGLARLVVQCRIGYGTARDALRTLRRVGLIELVARGNRRRGKSDRYRLILGAELLEHVKVPSPDEERAEIGEVAARNRAGGRERQRRLALVQASANEPISAGTRTGLALAPDTPPSIGTSPVTDPPPDDGDLRTEPKVVGHAQPVDNPGSQSAMVGGDAPLAALARGTDETDCCPACGVLLDPGRVCGNRQCTNYGRRP